jgi:hypothetical protein
MNRPPGWLEAAADRVMIQDLLARYVWEIDHGTPEGFAALFTPDGVFEVPQAKVRVEGRAGIVAFASDLQRTLPNVHHVTTSLVVDLDGDRATGRCELNEFLARPEAIYPNLQGWYEDEYAFDGERWRIAYRRVFNAEPASAKAGKVGEHFAAFLEACRNYRRR